MSKEHAVPGGTAEGMVKGLNLGQAARHLVGSVRIKMNAEIGCTALSA